MTITLITGANKGLGRETARRLLEVGHTVLVGARDAERGRRAADELGAAFLEIDPTSDLRVAAAAERVGSEYGRLDVLVTKAALTMLTEGTDAIVRLATLPKDGPTGTFQDRNGAVPW
jgi:NAD(P)-dependent dehydrogenase (short-subunit alcohol dehydrogenase family)